MVSRGFCSAALPHVPLPVISLIAEYLCFASRRLRRLQKATEELCDADETRVSSAFPHRATGGRGAESRDVPAVLPCPLVQPHNPSGGGSGI